MARRIRTETDARNLLYEQADDEPRRRDSVGRWNTLDADVGWSSPPIKVFPLTVRDDPSAVAEFVGQEWPTVRATEHKREGCIYWGVLRRQPTGEIVLGEIAIAPLTPSRLTSTMLRSVSLERVLTRARSEVRDNADWLTVARKLDWELPSAKKIREIKALADEIQQARSERGRRRKPREFYRAFALDALELAGSGVGRGLRGALAAKHHVEVGTIRDWLRRCRDLGYLAPAEWGKAGVAPGPNLNEEEER